jgi:hypothetical protein
MVAYPNPSEASPPLEPARTSRTRYLRLPRPEPRHSLGRRADSDRAPAGAKIAYPAQGAAGGSHSSISLLEALFRDAGDQPLAEGGERRALAGSEVLQDPADDTFSGRSNPVRQSDAASCESDRARPSVDAGSSGGKSLGDEAIHNTHGARVGQPDNLTKSSYRSAGHEVQQRNQRGRGDAVQTSGHCGGRVYPIADAYRQRAEQVRKTRIASTLHDLTTGVYVII